MDLTAFATEAKAIAEKRSYVKTAFNSLIEKMSEYVRDVQDTLPPIRAVLVEEKEEHHYIRAIALVYHSTRDAFFSVEHTVYLEDQPDDVVWSSYNPSVKEIREIVQKVPEALEDMLIQLRQFGTVADEAKSFIEDLLAKITTGEPEPGQALASSF